MAFLYLLGNAVGGPLVSLVQKGPADKSLLRKASSHVTFKYFYCDSISWNARHIAHQRLKVLSGHATIGLSQQAFDCGRCNITI